MIIKIEDVFQEFFSNIGEIDGIGKLHFGYGDEKELDNILLTKKVNRKKAYPLCWYLMPNKINVKPSQGYAEGNFTFLIAHNTRLDWFNDQRFKEVFTNVLYPYLEVILKAFDKSRRIMPDEEYETTNYPNYTKTQTNKDGKKTVHPEYWDALRLDIKLKINNGNNC